MAYVLLLFISLFYAVASAGVVLYFGARQRNIGTLLIGLLLLSVVVPFFLATRLDDYQMVVTVGFWMTLAAATGTSILLTVTATRKRQDLRGAVLVTSIVGMIVYICHVYLLSHQQ